MKHRVLHYCLSLLNNFGVARFVTRFATKIGRASSNNFTAKLVVWITHMYYLTVFVNEEFKFHLIGAFTSKSLMRLHQSGLRFHLRLESEKNPCPLSQVIYIFVSSSIWHSHLHLQYLLVKNKWGFLTFNIWLAKDEWSNFPWLHLLFEE